MAKKPKQTLATISFNSEKEKGAAVRKSKVRHASLSHCARDLFKRYQP